MDGTRSAMILDYGDAMRATISTNHFHRFGLDHQQSTIKWEGTRGAIIATMGLLMNYPGGEPDAFTFCVESDDGVATWQSADLPGTWFPDAFIGTRASLMRAVDGTNPAIPTGVEDAYRTMALVDAACRSSHGGATPVDYDSEHNSEHDSEHDSEQDRGDNHG